MIMYEKIDTLIETNKSIGFEEMNELSLDLSFLETNFKLYLFNEKEIIHKLSHQHIYTKFWITTNVSLPNSKILISNIDNYPVSVLIANFINNFSF